MDAPFFEISKIESARRQLEVAIRLFFYDDDCIANFTLTWAVYNLLSDLMKKQGLKSELDRDLSFIVPEKRDEVRRVVREAGNYFKHADKDFKTLKFYYKPLEIYLFDSCRMYDTLTKNKTAVMSIFTTWYFVHHDGLLMPDVENSFSKTRSRLLTKSKVDFFNDMLPISMMVKK